MNGSWLTLAAPVGFVVYLALLLGVLWLAVRVVRLAWYWQPKSERSRH
jgi:hypothetical protein